MVLWFRCLALALLFGGSAALAQGDAVSTYPSRTINIIVPFSQGVPADINIRIIVQRMAEDFSQPIILQHRPGADGATGAQAVAKAKPDGYTLLAATEATLALNPASKTNLPYNPSRDFAAVSLIAKNSFLLSVRASNGPNTVQELISRAKANSGKLKYGIGSNLTKLAGYQFARLAGIDVLATSYKSSAEVVQALLNGDVEFIIDTVASSLPLVQNGDFRALAKLDNRPLAALPDLQPLSVAAGLSAVEETSSWIGIVAPAGTPSGILDKIQRELVKIYTDPGTIGRLNSAALTASTSTPAEFDSLIRSEIQRWTKLFKESGITPD